MKDKMVFKDFIGTIHYSDDDQIFYGKIEGINDLVTFEGDNVKALKKAFEEAVEDYMILCEEINKDPKKSFKGSFNVRISPDLHSKAYNKALLEGKSLNQLVRDALEKEVLKNL
jgi:predicted HicB family RNase H-like nuclease